MGEAELTSWFCDISCILLWLHHKNSYFTGNNTACHTSYLRPQKRKPLDNFVDVACQTVWWDRLLITSHHITSLQPGKALPNLEPDGVDYLAEYEQRENPESTEDGGQDEL